MEITFLIYAVRMLAGSVVTLQTLVTLVPTNNAASRNSTDNRRHMDAVYNQKVEIVITTPLMMVPPTNILTDTRRKK